MFVVEFSVCFGLWCLACPSGALLCSVQVWFLVTCYVVSFAGVWPFGWAYCLWVPGTVHPLVAIRCCLWGLWVSVIVSCCVYAICCSSMVMAGLLQVFSITGVITLVFFFFAAGWFVDLGWLVFFLCVCFILVFIWFCLDVYIGCLDTNFLILLMNASILPLAWGLGMGVSFPSLRWLVIVGFGQMFNFWLLSVWLVAAASEDHPWVVFVASLLFGNTGMGRGLVFCLIFWVGSSLYTIYDLLSLSAHLWMECHYCYSDCVTIAWWFSIFSSKAMVGGYSNFLLWNFYYFFVISYLVLHIIFSAGSTASDNFAGELKLTVVFCCFPFFWGAPPCAL